MPSEYWPDPPPGRRFVEADELQHRVDALHRDPMVRTDTARASRPPPPVCCAASIRIVVVLRPPRRLTKFFDFDHGRRLAAAGVTTPFDERRATRTMAALTAMIDRRPTHCSVSPMPSPQYGLEGPTSTGMT
jgi:hypothetical protein